jgi:hypothetical protein
VHTFLGLLGLAIFVPCVITLAAGLTWAVVKMSPPADGSDAAKATPPASS